MALQRLEKIEFAPGNDAPAGRPDRSGDTAALGGNPERPQRVEWKWRCKGLKRLNPRPAGNGAVPEGPEEGLAGFHAFVLHQRRACQAPRFDVTLRARSCADVSLNDGVDCDAGSGHETDGEIRCLSIYEAING